MSAPQYTVPQHTRQNETARDRLTVEGNASHQQIPLKQNAKTVRKGPVVHSPSPRFAQHAAAKQQKRASAGKPAKPKRPWFIRRIINRWFDRLLGAVTQGEFSDRPEYAAHRTTKDYVWNTIGFATWGMVFPLLTIVVTQLVGVEEAGMFSLAFVTGMVLMVVANYGMRSYQVSDIQETHSFATYQVHRWLTCAVMVVVGILYCMVRGYGGMMLPVSIGVYLYKMIDGLADVYEGRLQQADKLYLGGVSQTLRSVAVFVVATLVLLVTRNLVVAAIAMAVVAAASFVLVTLPLTLFETPRSRGFKLTGVVDLLKRCFPLFIALFLYTLIDNMPKFVMEGTLDYSSQLYFNALYFPAQAVMLTVGFIYKPQLVRLANVWATPSKRRRFDILILGMVALVVAITVIGVLLMSWIGIPVLGFLYGLDFTPFTQLCFIMLVAGGVTGIIDFLYQVITVLRQQQAVTKLYLVTFGFSLLILLLLIPLTGLPGAVTGYLIVMTILLVLLVWEYIRIRTRAAQEQAEEGAQIRD